jgi:hypothetical protein
MPETIRFARWHWYDVMSDLEEQGGLAGVIINPSLMDAHGCGGETEKGTKFYITWQLDMFLLVSMDKEEQALIEAFAKVVGYRPFCHYINRYGLFTVEWDKKDPEGRFAEILKKEGVKKLQRAQ